MQGAFPQRTLNQLTPSGRCTIAWEKTIWYGLHSLTQSSNKPQVSKNGGTTVKVNISPRTFKHISGWRISNKDNGAPTFRSRESGQTYRNPPAYITGSCTNARVGTGGEKNPDLNESTISKRMRTWRDRERVNHDIGIKPEESLDNESVSIGSSTAPMKWPPRNEIAISPFSGDDKLWFSLSIHPR